MTGFHALTDDSPWGSVSIEFRSVNGRYLETNVRLADAWRGLEPAVRDAIGKRVRRGKVECRIAVRERAGESTAGALEDATLERLSRLEQTVRFRFPEARALSVDEVLRWPGALAEPSALESRRDWIMERVHVALEGFIGSRGREGERLVAIIRESAREMQTLVDTLIERVPVLVQAQQQRLTERLREALTAGLGPQAAAAVASALGPAEASDATVVTPGEAATTPGEPPAPPPATDIRSALHQEIAERIRQEVATLGLRADVAEELGRLKAHLAELERALSAGGPVGKRLDFLCQELNREANTLGSKAVAIELTNTSMALKLLIEQIREQVQNLE
ncbi:MAG: YicC family protein [Burkholderiales bacterium]|nr:MAG: YicC family protein [Burkholderiales bacterium]